MAAAYLTASLKSPVMSVIADRNRLPKLWPSSPSPALNRYWKSLDSRASFSARATMQLRMSPGGGTFSSLRSRPLEPPVKRLFARQDYVLLQAVEQRRESSSPTHGYNLQGAHFGGMVGTLHD